MYFAAVFCFTLLLSVTAQEITCADGKSKCPSGTTCCDLGGGHFGCCPVPNAVCCEDHLHCCPAGTECDVSEGRCTNRFTGEKVPLLRKIPALAINSNKA